MPQTQFAAFLDGTRQKAIGIAPRYVLNMDQTPVYMDMIPTSTLHFKADSDVQLNNTGHSKDRLTVALTCTAAGTMLKAYVLFKNLKRIPKLNVPSNVHVNVSMSGSMKTAEVSVKCDRTWEIESNLQILDWVSNVVRPYMGMFNKEKSLCLLDAYSPHHRAEVTGHFFKLVFV